MRPYFKKKKKKTNKKTITKKGWWSGLSGKHACLASVEAQCCQSK
jgi:hypothetical protein